MNFTRHLLGAALLAAALPALAFPCQPAADGALAVQYAVRYSPHDGVPITQVWRLQREAQRLAWRRGDVEEIWLRQPDGLRLLRVFHADRQVADYAPGELKALGVAVSWDELAGLLAASQLSHLTATGTHYSGALGNEAVAVDWDAAAGLPERLVRRSDRAEVEFVRTACSAGGAVATNFAGYGRVDAADFGDMADDPFVRKAMGYDTQHGWREAHAH